MALEAPNHVKVAIGLKFNMITVKSYHKTDFTCGRRRYLVNCECDCGREFIARFDYIKSGTKKHCGCVKPKINPMQRQRFKIDFRNRQNSSFN